VFLREGDRLFVTLCYSGWGVVTQVSDVARHVGEGHVVKAAGKRTARKRTARKWAGERDCGRGPRESRGGSPGGRPRKKTAAEPGKEPGAKAEEEDRGRKSREKVGKRPEG